MKLADVPPDGCPECLVTSADPQQARDLGDQIRAAYCCPNCGHRWTTSWLVSALAASPEHTGRRAS